MAFKKKGKSFRKKTAKRTPRFTRKKVVRNQTMVKLGQGLPKNVVVTHKYSDNITLTSTLGVMGVQLYAANGMFDPNISLAGHQPLYFDQFSALYNHYTVIGAKIRIRVCTNTPTLSMIVAMLVNDNTTLTPTSISGVEEQSLGKTRLIPAGMDVPTTFTAKWSAKKFFPGSVLARDTLRGTPSTNPTELSYFSIYLQDPAATATVACTVQVEIEQIAIWSELKDVDQS